MGRLFWKFFFFIVLAQMAGVAGTGVVFWLEREAWASGRHAPPPPLPPPAPMAGQPPPGPPPHRPPPFRVPVIPMLAAMLTSLASAAGLAWYVSRPVRRLRGAFDAVARGNLAMRIGASMGARRDELADLGHDFDRMAMQLELLVSGQRRLLHDVSHEVRSPLARLQAAIGLIRQRPERLDELLSRLENESERMDRLIGELLTLARLESGQRWPIEEVEVGELLQLLLADARFEAESAGVVIVSRLPAVPLLVSANAELLHRAFENVLRNALHHSPAGGEVLVELDAVSGGRVRVAISDQGPGVPSDQLEAIFQPFCRLEASGGGAGRTGYGLGLAIARQALMTLGGYIAAEPAPAGGLRVVMGVPCRQP